MTTSPFVIDTGELGRSPGTMLEITRDLTLTGNLGTDLISVPAGAVLHLDMRLESVMEGVLATGTATGVAAGECVRCLRPVTEDVEVEFTELFSYPEHAPEVGEDDDPEPVVADGAIDLERVITDALVLQLPLNPVCEEDCPGLCQICGVELADHPGHEHEEPIDPRWAALGQLVEPDEGA